MPDLDSSTKPEGVGTLVELARYMERGDPITRVGVNARALVGCFALALAGAGWLLMLDVFRCLAKCWVGMIYLGVAVAVFKLGAHAEESVALTIPLYIAAWIHANVVRRRYTRTALARVHELEQESPRSTDGLLEEGRLRDCILSRHAKISGEKEKAVACWAAITDVSGVAEPLLLLPAAFGLANAGQKQRAGEFIDEMEKRLNPADGTQLAASISLARKLL